MRSLVAVMALSLVSRISVAQVRDTTPPAQWAKGMSIGFPGADGQAEASLFTVAGNFTRIDGPVGIDVSVMTMPRAFVAGILPVIGRFGVAVPIRLGPDAYLAPGAGVVALTAISGGGGGATGGMYAGAALFLFGPESNSGMRVGYNVHAIEGGAIWHLEVGFVGRRAGTKRD